MTTIEHKVAPTHSVEELAKIASRQPPSLADQRRAMLNDTAAMLSSFAQLDGRYIASVLAAMDAVPRERFMPPDVENLAYLPMSGDIGWGQSISHPHVVAIMTSVVRPSRSSRVLDVGTGSGYQAAVLAHLVDSVISIEIIPQLATSARRRLAGLGFSNVEVVEGDVIDGWIGASFDAIVVAAGCDAVPLPLLRSLAPGGRLVMPIGPTEGEERLTLVEPTSAGLRHVDLGAAPFVPLTGRYGRSAPRR